MRTVQVRVRIPVELLPQIERLQKVTGLRYPGEVLLLVFQWFLARPTDKVGQALAHKEIANTDPDPSTAPCSLTATSLRDFMRSLAG
ncbi:MAG: hypothetical protein Q6M54_05710 [Thermostichus sp. DRC_bins_24]